MLAWIYADADDPWYYLGHVRIAFSLKGFAVKSVLRDHSLERPPVLKDIIFDKYFDIPLYFELVTRDHLS